MGTSKHVALVGGMLFGGDCVNLRGGPGGIRSLGSESVGTASSDDLLSWAS